MRPHFLKSRMVAPACSSSVEITLNGHPRFLAEQATVAAVLRDIDIDPTNAKGIAVAVNEKVVPRSAWAGRGLRSGDRVEVITARQGG